MRLRCLFGHEWEAHPAFENLPVRRCVRCLRVETAVFGGNWRHVPWLDGLSERQCRVRAFHRGLAREVNRQLMRRGDPRAIW